MYVCFVSPQERILLNPTHNCNYAGLLYLQDLVSICSMCARGMHVSRGLRACMCARGMYGACMMCCQCPGDGYMKVDHNRITRPRGFSSPSPIDHTPGREQSPLPEDSSLSSTPFKLPTYDLPSNSRKLQALNVTLRRSSTPQTEYAKLCLSKEAILLRSGVTLRRHVRESLSSLSSYASHMDGEQGGEEGRRGRKDSGGTSDEEDTLEPINKLVAMEVHVHAAHRGTLCSFYEMFSHGNISILTTC